MNPILSELTLCGMARMLDHFLLMMLDGLQSSAQRLTRPQAQLWFIIAFEQAPEYSLHSYHHGYPGESVILK